MKRKSKIEKIYEELEQMESLKVLTDEQYFRLRELSKHRDSTVRFGVPKVLCFFPTPQSEDILSILMEDKDELVRVNACDSIGFSKSKVILDRLKKKAKKDTVLVRSYAILSLADIAINTKNEGIKNEVVLFIQNRLLEERETQILIPCYRALCVLGLSKYYLMLLSFLNDPIYQNRCAVINAIKELVDKENSSITKKKLIERYDIEETRAVKGGIESLLNLEK